MPSRSSSRLIRSWLFAPGHNQRILAKAFEVGADEVLLDLEDGVGPEFKEQARGQVVDVFSDRPAWVRINVASSPAAKLDLEAVGGLADGIRVPNLESPAEVSWVTRAVANFWVNDPVTTSWWLQPGGRRRFSPWRRATRGPHGTTLGTLDDDVAILGRAQARPTAPSYEPPRVASS